MRTLSASEAHSNLYRLMDQTAESHQPIVITGRRHRGGAGDQGPRVAGRPYGEPFPESAALRKGRG